MCTWQRSTHGHGSELGKLILVLSESCRLPQAIGADSSIAFNTNIQFRGRNILAICLMGWSCQKNSRRIPYSNRVHTFKPEEKLEKVKACVQVACVAANGPLLPLCLGTFICQCVPPAPVKYQLNKGCVVCVEWKLLLQVAF
jgi:hypothetical protein